MHPFDEHESEVRSYCRRFDVLFSRAAGSVNYGHNPPELKQSLLTYLQQDGICAGLDLQTPAKAAFIDAFQRIILRPRRLEYRMQFTGPTGASAVESAVKLARKITGRRVIGAFTNGFHGMSSTALGLTGNCRHRQAWCDPHVFRLPYDGYLGAGIDTLNYFEKLLTDASSGLDLPAAIIVETVQCEGGVNVASPAWLSRLRQLTDEWWFGISRRKQFPPAAWILV